MSSASRTATGDPDARVAVYLALGSNLGDRRAHLAHALRRLATETDLTGLSPVYETAPVGYLDQGPFLNMVARVETDRSPERLLDLVRVIERERGRERTFPNAPRTLDIDILLYGDRIVDRPGLTIPHPRMAERAFVLVPLLALAPAATDPGTGEPLADALDRLRPEAGGVEGGREPGGVRKVLEGEELMGDDVTVE